MKQLANPSVRGNSRKMKKVPGNFRFPGTFDVLPEFSQCILLIAKSGHFPKFHIEQLAVEQLVQENRSRSGYRWVVFGAAQLEG